MNLRIAFEKTTRSDVLCIACGRFGADHQAVGSEDYGVHKKCAPSVQVKFTRKRRAPAAA